MTARAITSRRWYYWASFSTKSALLGAFGTFVIMAFVAAVGVVSGRVIGGSVPGFAQDLFAALIATAALRRVRGSERGATLALGFVPEIHEWVDTHVGYRVEAWAQALPDAALIEAAAVLDDKAKGLGRRASFDQRADWREGQAARLGSINPAIQNQARQDLIAMIAVGYVQYQLRRRS